MTAAKTHNQILDMDDSSQDSPSDHRQSSEPGTTNHHRYYEVNTNIVYRKILQTYHHYVREGNAKVMIQAIKYQWSQDHPMNT